MDPKALLAQYGPMTTSRAARLLVERGGLTPEAARQRVSRRTGVDTLGGLIFPKRARFIYLRWQFGTDQYWQALIRAIREDSPAHAAALGALQARGGISLERHFDIISGSPVRQKRQIASEAVLKALESVQLVRIESIEGLGRCVILGNVFEDLSLRSKRLKAILMTESVLLDAVRTWSARLNLASANTIRIRDDEEERAVLTCRFDLTGPSYLQPLVTYVSDKLQPGFLVADVLLGRDLDESMVAAFLRKCVMLASFRKARPFLPMLIADSFSLGALKACRKKGIIATRPETLFGRDVAQALEDLLHTLTNTSTGTIERVEKIFSKLSAVEGAAGNLRGALFELIVGHCVRAIEGGEIGLGRLLTDYQNHARAEVDVLWELQHRVVAYECKGYRSPVKGEEVERWLKHKVPIIFAALKQQDRYSGANVRFEFWTSSTFDDDATALLRQAAEKTKRYRIGWKNGTDIRLYSQGLTSPGLRKIFDEHYFKDVLSAELTSVPS